MSPRPRACLDCGRIAEPGRSRCATHERGHRQAKERRAQARDPRRAIYLTAAWQRARAAVRHRAGDRCEHVDEHGRCEATRTPDVGDVLQVHHVTPLAAGGDPFALDNLIALCPAHHRQAERQARQAAQPPEPELAGRARALLERPASTSRPRRWL